MEESGSALYVPTNRPQPVDLQALQPVCPISSSARTAYEQTVNALATASWLTTAQATTLRTLAADP